MKGKKNTVAQSTVKMPPLRPGPINSLAGNSGKGTKSNGIRASMAPSLMSKEAPKQFNSKQTSQLTESSQNPSYGSKKIQFASPKKPVSIDDIDDDELYKELEDEFGITVSDDELHEDWLDHIDELDKQLEQNLKDAQTADTSPIIAFENATNSVKDEGDPFEAIKHASDAGFQAISNCIQKDMQILRQRVSIMNQIRKEILEHTVLDETPDIEEDLNESAPEKKK